VELLELLEEELVEELELEEDAAAAAAAASEQESNLAAVSEEAPK